MPVLSLRHGLCLFYFLSDPFSTAICPYSCPKSQKHCDLASYCWGRQSDFVALRISFTSKNRESDEGVSRSGYIKAGTRPNLETIQPPKITQCQVGSQGLPSLFKLWAQSRATPTCKWQGPAAPAHQHPKHRHLRENRLPPENKRQQLLLAGFMSTVAISK